MTQPRRGQSRPSEVGRLREENRELREELARSSEQVLQLTQQLAAVEVIVRELAGGLDAVVSAWKTARYLKDSPLPSSRMISTSVGRYT